MTALLSRPLVVLGGALLCLTAVYSAVLFAPLCGFDDFIQLHDARFKDARQPSITFTTPISEGFKYRPLHRILHLGLDAITPYRAQWQLLRLKNLVFHVIAAVFLFLMLRILFPSVWLAASGALLFTFHPLTNQSITAGVFGIAQAGAVFNAALYFFLRALHRPAWWCLPGSLFCAFLGLLTYEPLVAYLPVCLLILFFLFLPQTRKRFFSAAVDRGFLWRFAGGALVVYGSYFLIRIWALPPGHTQLIPVKAIVFNAVSYVAAFTMPIDFLLAQALFDSPLPSEISASEPPLSWLTSYVLLATVAIVVYILRGETIRRNLRETPWLSMVVLLAAGILVMGPLIAYSPRPSESYAYLLALYWCPCLAVILALPFNPRSRFIYLPTLGVIALLFIPALWARNQNVRACATAVGRISAGLPDFLSRSKGPVLIAPSPEAVSLTPYGIYNHQGIDSLGIGDFGLRAIGRALQLFTNNPSLEVEVVTAAELSRRCASPAADRRLTCLSVRPDGSIDTVKTEQ